MRKHPFSLYRAAFALISCLFFALGVPALATRVGPLVGSAVSETFQANSAAARRSESAHQFEQGLAKAPDTDIIDGRIVYRAK